MTLHFVQLVGQLSHWWGKCSISLYVEKIPREMNSFLTKHRHAKSHFKTIHTLKTTEKNH